MHTQLNYNDLTFPVIWMTRKFARVCSDKRHLCSFDSGLVNAGYCKEVVIVDSDFTCYETQTRKAGGVPPFLGYRINFRRVLVLDYYLKSEPRTIQVQELAEMIHKISGRHLANAIWLPGERDELFQKMTTWEKVLERLGGVKKRKWWESFWFNIDRF
jgi:hypothetical protein